MSNHTALANQLAQWLTATDLKLLELTGPETALRLRRHGEAFEVEPFVPCATTAPAASTVVRAGSVGVVLHAHPLRTEPLVRVGQSVVTGQTVSLLKIGAVLLAVHAPRAGIVSRIAAAHEAAVGFGDPLVEIA